MKINTFLNYFESVKSTGNNQWRALCPAHNDHSPSLSITDKDGKILLHCFAGCQATDILERVGLKMKDLFPNNDSSSTKILDKIQYEYYKANGELAYIKTRINYADNKKSFSFEQPNGNRNLKGIERVPYNLPEVCKASKVYIVEGEKCAEAVISAGRTATTLDSGSNSKWEDSFSEYFKDKEIIIIPDNDDPGRKYAQAIKKHLPNSKVVIIPDLKEKEDIYDWLNAGHTMDEFDKLPSVNDDYFSNEVVVMDNTTKNHSGRTTQSETLIKLVEKNGAMFFHDDKSVAYAAVFNGEIRKIWEIDSEVFRFWLMNLYYSQYKKPVTKKALDEAIMQLQAMAIFDSKERNLSVRVAKSDNNTFWYDLCNDKWQAVKITADGWSVEDKPPMLFVRYNHQKGQITPNSEGDIRRILKYINIQKNHTLLLCWLVSCFIPDIPHAMLILHGEKGAAKTTAFELLKKIIDPSALETLMLTDSKSLFVSLQRHCFLPFDNISSLSPEKSDILCRAVTGGGIQQRKLYTNGDDYIFSIKRCIALNGINNVASRSDLIDRAIMIELFRISEENRREISELQREFENDLPYIMSGIFDILSKAMELYPTIKLENLPRMADFAHWGYAIGEALGGLGQTFIDEYKSNQKDRDDEILYSDLVAVIITAFMNNIHEWEGTVSQLYLELTQLAPNIGINARSKEFPQSANHLSRRLRSIRSNLESAGITFDTKSKSDGTHITIWNEKVPPLSPYHHPNMDKISFRLDENTDTSSNDDDYDDIEF